MKRIKSMQEMTKLLDEPNRIVVDGSADCLLVSKQEFEDYKKLFPQGAGFLKPTIWYFQGFKLKLNEKTNRGFKIYTEFKDTYCSNVVVQESSSVLKRCWIFVNNDGKNPRSNLVTDGAIHLNTQQAKRIIKSLEKFIKEK